MFKLVPLLISFCLFCFFLSLIAIDKKNSVQFFLKAVSSRHTWSERHIFERRYACAFHFVFSGSEALYSAHSPVIQLELSATVVIFRYHRPSKSHVKVLWIFEFIPNLFVPHSFARRYWFVNSALVTWR